MSPSTLLEKEAQSERGKPSEECLGVFYVDTIKSSRFGFILAGVFIALPFFAYWIIPLFSDSINAFQIITGNSKIVKWISALAMLAYIAKFVQRISMARQGDEKEILRVYPDRVVYEGTNAGSGVLLREEIASVLKTEPNLWTPPCLMIYRNMKAYDPKDMAKLSTLRELSRSQIICNYVRDYEKAYDLINKVIARETGKVKPATKKVEAPKKDVIEDGKFRLDCKFEYSTLSKWMTRLIASAFMSLPIHGFLMLIGHLIFRHGTHISMSAFYFPPVILTIMYYYDKIGFLKSENLDSKVEIGKDTLKISSNNLSTQIKIDELVSVQSLHFDTLLYGEEGYVILERESTGQHQMNFNRLSSIPIGPVKQPMLLATLLDEWINGKGIRADHWQSYLEGKLEQSELLGKEVYRITPNRNKLALLLFLMPLVVQLFGFIFVALSYGAGHLVAGLGFAHDIISHYPWTCFGLISAFVGLQALFVTNYLRSMKNLSYQFYKDRLVVRHMNNHIFRCFFRSIFSGRPKGGLEFGMDNAEVMRYKNIRFVKSFQTNTMRLLGIHEMVISNHDQWNDTGRLGIFHRSQFMSQRRKVDYQLQDTKGTVILRGIDDPKKHMHVFNQILSKKGRGNKK